MKLKYVIATWISTTFPKARKSKLLTTFFDKALLLNTYIFNNETYKNIQKLTLAIKQWDNVEITNHAFGGSQFNYYKNEICHIHGNGILDIYWKTTEERDYLIIQKICEKHYIEPNSKWTTFYINANNLEKAIAFARLSYESIVFKRSFLEYKNH